MANELNIQLDPFTEQGLTLIAKVLNKTGLQLGSDVAMTESSTGFYTGNFALGSISDGDYIVKFQSTTDFYGSGILSVKDNAEVVPSTLTSAEVATELATYDAPTKAELDAGIATVLAATSGLATQASIAALNDISATDVQNEVDYVIGQAALSTFDPANDVVTTDGASREASKADVSGLSTFDPINDEVTAVNVATDVQAALTAYDAPSNTELDAAVAGLSTFDVEIDHVITDTASREASKADVSGLATGANISAVESDLNTMNTGIQKSSKLIPYSDGL